MEEKLIEIVILVLNLDGDIHIDLSTKISELPLDSLSFVLLVTKIEEAFNFEFDDNMLMVTNFQTIQSLMDYITQKQTQNNNIGG